MTEIKLPPLPAWTAHCYINASRYDQTEKSCMWLETLLKEYATAAIEADRQARGEPIAWISDSPTKGNGRRLFWNKTDAWRWSSNIKPLYTAPHPQQIPEGYKIVPIEPTEEMINAANQGDRLYTDRCFGKDMPTVMQGPYDNYKAMLEAAPKT